MPPGITGPSANKKQRGGLLYRIIFACKLLKNRNDCLYLLAKLGLSDPHSQQGRYPWTRQSSSRTGVRLVP
jgi:hypothetical protein